MRREDPVLPLKRQLAGDLAGALKGWRPTEIYFRLRLDQPRVWELRHGRLERFSLQRLVRLLAELGYDTSISVVKRGVKAGVSRK